MESTSNHTLLSEFTAATYDEWRTAAEKLLKGAPFDKIMRTPTPEEITLEPIYRREDLDSVPAASTLPGQNGFTRGGNAGGYREEPWKIAQELPYGEPAEFNQAALHDLSRGQDSLNIIFDIATLKGLDPDHAADGEVGACGLSVASLPDLRRALKGVYPNAIPIYFQSGCSGLAMLALFRAWLKEKRDLDLSEIRGAMGIDPLAMLAAAGSLPASLPHIYDEMTCATKTCREETPRFLAVGVNTMHYHSAGANATQEIAIALATGVEYLRALTDRGMAVDDASKQIRFTLSIGPNFFMEISKFRAFRQLWSNVIEALGVSVDSESINLHARTGLHNKTRNDPYANMLRTTTEALAGVIAGVDSLCVGSFDEIIRVPNEFSRRVARNTQLILQEECELTSVIDPAGGSWFVENLTQEVAQEAWKTFQGIEASGGMSSALKSGFIQKQIATTEAKQTKLVGQRRVALVGTNQYPNLGEVPLEVTLPDYKILRKRRANESTSFRLSAESDIDSQVIGQLAEIQTCSYSELIPKSILAVSSGATLGELTRTIRTRDIGKTVEVDPLPNRRLAAMYEELRAASLDYQKANGNSPQIFLANIGALRRHKLRADFTRAFFATGGFECIYSPGFTDAGSASQAFVDSGAEIAVICGTDDDYIESVPTFAAAIKEAAPTASVILAGFPGEKEATYREAGLDDYIFVKSDNYATNRSYLEKLEVL
ncbi:MAG: methylmalonyl-CoA mutase family protein [Verrucomicrobiota bacterium]